MAIKPGAGEKNATAISVSSQHAIFRMFLVFLSYPLNFTAMRKTMTLVHFAITGRGP